MDGRSERASTSYGHYDGGDYKRIRQINLPHSLGLLYEDVTRYLGFLHSSDEYEVMALAFYGKPAYLKEFREILRSDGAGTALGAALWVDAEKREKHGRNWTMEHAYLGPGYPDSEIELFLQRSHVACRRLEDVVKAAADWLAEEKILGWFQGRIEFGPRALGARSILASPRNANMQARLNEPAIDPRPRRRGVIRVRAGLKFFIIDRSTP